MNTKQANDPLMQFVHLAKLSGMEQHPQTLRALKFMQLNPENYQTNFVQRIMGDFQQIIFSNTLNGDSVNPFRHGPGQDVSGQLRTGKVIQDFQNPELNGQMFGLYPIELCSHTMICGANGTGKTNLGAYVLPLEIYRFNKTLNLQGDERIGCLFIATAKNDENYLANIIPEMLFFNSGNLKINPLFHNCHDKDEIFQRFIKLLGEVCFFREGSANTLSKLLQQLDKQFNGQPFSLYELLEAALKLPKSRYEEILPNRIQGMLSNKARNIYDCSEGIPLEKLAHEFVIFDLTDLDFYSQQFIAIYIFQYLTEYFKNQPEKRLNTVLFYDEGDHIFGKHSETALIGYSTASSLLTTSRASGIGAVVITHQPSKIISTLRSEAYTKIIFNLPDAQDAHCMAQACSMAKEEEGWISRLPNYMGLVKFRRCPKPFIIKTPNVADVLRTKQPIISQEAKKIIADLQKQVIPRNAQQPTETFETPQNPPNSVFNSEEKALIKTFLEHVFSHPYENLVDRYKALSLSTSKGQKLVGEIEKKGLAKRVSVKTRKGRGNNFSLFLELTASGRDYLGKAKQPTKEGKAGLKHCYYVKRIAEYYEKKGLETKKEFKNCDIAINTPEGPIAIEVSIHTTNLQENIRRNQANGFKKTILVFENKETLEKAKTRILPLFQSCTLKIIDEFL